jgi:hypothetical protein
LGAATASSVWDLVAKVLAATLIHLGAEQVAQHARAQAAKRGGLCYLLKLGE